MLKNELVTGFCVAMVINGFQRRFITVVCMISTVNYEAGEEL